ncbi:MAG TPA: hypothetical protein DCM62_06910 [Bacteroidales bacterium]|nr:hypothetical protein [Bacteroidales bacterium]
MRNLLGLFLIVGLLVGLPQPTRSCTSVLASRGATADGSVMTSYTYDVAGFASPLYFYPGGTYQPGDSLSIFGFRDGAFLGKILQVPKTYKVVGNMNEHQVVIGETTFGGRTELHGGTGVFDYGNLMIITLQRARTAREAIRIFDALAQKYGYRDTGETFFFADENEVWIMDFIGKGQFEKGAVWVAARVPEGYIAAHANQGRIRYIDWNDRQNWMWSADVVDFARERGWFRGSRNQFSFREAYNPITPRSLLLCEGRVWSIYRRAAPSQYFSDKYWRGVEGAEPYPLFIRPDKPLTVGDMKALVRDHFHGTPYFTREGYAAGPFGSPYRFRPLGFNIEGDTMDYSWARAISQPQTAYSFITQSRNWMPDAIGGIVWYGLDDTYTNVFMPLYVGMTRSPQSLSVACPITFDWNSAYWVFNKVANHAYPLFNIMIGDIQEVQTELESRAQTMVQAVDKAALVLHEHSPQFLHEYLTDFSVNFAESVVDRWRQLAFHLFVRYNDGFIRGTESVKDWPVGIGYPQDFKRRAVESRPGFYDVRWRKPGEPVR